MPERKTQERVKPLAARENALFARYDWRNIVTPLFEGRRSPQPIRFDRP
jgi:hypothetical protein